MKLSKIIISLAASIFSSLSMADNRVSIEELSSNQIHEQASAVALVISNGAIYQDNDSASLGIYTRTLKNVHGLCEDAKFANENSVVGSCTAFLVAPNKVITSPHCIMGPRDCSSKKIFFNFSNTTQDLGKLSKDNLYSCVGADGNLINNVGGAYRIVTLDRDVVGITPLEIDYTAVEVGTEVYSISHSHGLAAKLTSAKVYESTPNWDRFRAGLAAIKGSEGAPIFSGETGMVVGVQTSNLNSYTKANPYRGCNELKICEGDECTNEILGMSKNFPEL